MLFAWSRWHHDKTHGIRDTLAFRHDDDAIVKQQEPMQGLTAVSWWGKAVGGAFGFILGGPLGALLGMALGHQFDHGFEGLLSDEHTSQADMERIHEAALVALEEIGLSDAPESGIEYMVAAGAILGEDNKPLHFFLNLAPGVLHAKTS